MDNDQEIKAAEEGYVSAATDAIRQVFSSKEGIATALSKDSLTVSYVVPRSALSRGQLEAIMSAHLVNT